ncbi:hypothetical protein Anapl_02215 [Anas platyrhynchos]|uniref:Uncharacterized protein n=1 Tax=Anas platyrhynchos TaxID=8839 RepID=R0LD16_ANAPL|nr:hypothetical protein Anapl_02215 [Anas platyrhynchos]
MLQITSRLSEAISLGLCLDLAAGGRKTLVEMPRAKSMRHHQGIHTSSCGSESCPRATQRALPSTAVSVLSAKSQLKQKNRAVLFKPRHLLKGKHSPLGQMNKIRRLLARERRGDRGSASMAVGVWWLTCPGEALSCGRRMTGFSLQKQRVSPWDAAESDAVIAIASVFLEQDALPASAQLVLSNEPVLCDAAALHVFCRGVQLEEEDGERSGSGTCSALGGISAVPIPVPLLIPVWMRCVSVGTAVPRCSWGCRHKGPKHHSPSWHLIYPKLERPVLPLTVARYRATLLQDRDKGTMIQAGFYGNRGGPCLSSSCAACTRTLQLLDRRPSAGHRTRPQRQLPSTTSLGTGAGVGCAGEGKCWFISSLLCNILRRQHLYHKSWVFSAADGAMSCTAISSDLPTSCSVESLPFAAKSKGAMPPVCRLPPPSPRSSRGLSLCPSRCFPGNFEGGPHARRRCTHVLLTLPAPPRPPPPPRPHPAASTELAEGEGQRGSVSNSVAGTRELVRGRGCRVCFAVASSHSSDLADRSRGGFGAHGACRGGVKCIWQALKWCKGGVSCICIELSSPADHNEHLQQLTGDGQHGCARRVTELLVVYVCKEGYCRLT